MRISVKSNINQFEAKISYKDIVESCRDKTTERKGSIMLEDMHIEKQILFLDETQDLYTPCNFKEVWP